jgi:hypothetical protein
MMEDITPKGSVAPVYLVPLTEEEVAEYEQRRVGAIADERANADDIAALAAARESAHTKLANLGLAPDEIAAILTP